MREIKLSKGYTALVDDEDYDLVSQHKWYPVISSRRTYAQTSVSLPNGKYTSLSMHRVILGITDRKVWVDHEDHEGLNNQKYNLRQCNASKNIGNSRKCLRPTTSRFKGVVWNKQRSNWLAQITVSKKTHYLGSFACEDTAARVYDSAALLHFGEFACLNFPNSVTPTT